MMAFHLNRLPSFQGSSDGYENSCSSFSLIVLKVLLVCPEVLKVDSILSKSPIASFETSSLSLGRHADFREILIKIMKLKLPYSFSTVGFYFGVFNISKASIKTPVRSKICIWARLFIFCIIERELIHYKKRNQKYFYFLKSPCKLSYRTLK